MVALVRRQTGRSLCFILSDEQGIFLSSGCSAKGSAVRTTHLYNAFSINGEPGYKWRKITQMYWFICQERKIHLVVPEMYFR
jgi:hypothetical protein|uniref:Uncharacterized protein n=1 Tax=Zea mays TaxID=4577 RepID=B4FNV2_MAIZE|nr:unknown [Zea mays]